MAEELGVNVQEVRHFRRAVYAESGFVTSSGLIVDKGTIAALHWGLQGMIDGQVRLVIEHYERLDPAIAPEWDQPPGTGGYRFTIKGTPGMKVDLAFDGDPLLAAEWATANRALNVIGDVVRAKSGFIKKFTDLPFRPGLMRGSRR